MKKILTGLILAILPALTFASDKGMGGFLDNLGGWVSTLGKIIFAAVVVGFFYGLLLFMISEDKRDEGKSLMLWGIIAIFVMASVWGLVSFIQSSVGVDGSKGADDYSNIIPSISSDSGTGSSGAKSYSK